MQRKTISIYAQILLHDLGYCPGGSSQKQGIDASRGSASAGNGEVNPDSEHISTGQNTTKITM
jgi:hypothetical protein